MSMNRQITPASRYWLIMGSIVGLGTLLRFAFCIDYAEEVDSIRFLLALDDFDVTVHRPHFPGYPVYVLLGKLLYWITGDQILALSALGAICGGLLPLPVGAIARTSLGDRAGLWAGLLVALNPLLWLYSTKLLSDMPGLLFLFSSLALLGRSWQLKSERLAWAGFFLLGLTMGVRLSYFPFVLSAIVISWFGQKKIGAPLLFLLLGGLAWALPFVLVSGAVSLLDIGAVQTAGHFTRWGGSILTRSDMVERVTALFWQLSAQGLGAWWSDRSWLYMIPTAGLAGVLVACRIGTRGLQRLPWTFWATWTLPYLLWIFLAQNITVKTRHCLPIVVIGLLFIAAELAGSIRRRDAHADSVGWAKPVAVLCAAMWLGGLIPSGFSLTWEHKAVPSNAVLLSQEVEQLCQRKKNDSPFVVYTSSMQRHLERHAPCAEVVRTRRLSQARREVSRRAPDVVAYVVSDVSRVGRLREPPVRQWQRNRYIQNARSETALFLLRGEKHER